MTKIAVVVGSLRAESLNKLLARNLEKLAPEGVEFDYVDISRLPLFNQELEEDFPQEAQAMKDIVEAADGVLFATAEYNHSLTGVLKNAIDWGSRPWGNNSWADKPTGVVGITTSPNGTRFAQATFMSIFEWFKAPLYTDQKIQMTVTDETFDGEGVISPDLKDELQTYIDGFIDWVRTDEKKTVQED